MLTVDGLLTLETQDTARLVDLDVNALPYGLLALLAVSFRPA